YELLHHKPAGIVLNHRTKRSGIHPKAEIGKAAEFKQRHAIATGNDRTKTYWAPSSSSPSW
ncbi:Os01g0569800, partial [Oryza sativa Japonica Group]